MCSGWIDLFTFLDQPDAICIISWFYYHAWLFPLTAKPNDCSVVWFLRKRQSTQPFSTGRKNSKENLIIKSRPFRCFIQIEAYLHTMAERERIWSRPLFFQSEKRNWVLCKSDILSPFNCRLRWGDWFFSHCLIRRRRKIGKIRNIRCNSSRVSSSTEPVFEKNLAVSNSRQVPFSNDWILESADQCSCNEP